MTVLPSSCWGVDRCGWSDDYGECPCVDYPPTPQADQQALFDMCLDDEPGPGSYGRVPGYCFGLGAKGGAWPATRRPVYRDWPDTVTNLPLPEETQ